MRSGTPAIDKPDVPSWWSGVNNSWSRGSRWRSSRWWIGYWWSSRQYGAVKQDRGVVGQLLNESLVWLPNSSGQGCRTHRHYSTCKQKIQVAWRGPRGVKPEGKTSLIEDHMARDDDALSGHVEAAVPLVGRGIAEKNTCCGARREFVASRGGQVRITETPKDT